MQIQETESSVRYCGLSRCPVRITKDPVQRQSGKLIIFFCSDAHADAYACEDEQFLREWRGGSSERIIAKDIRERIRQWFVAT